MGKRTIEEEIRVKLNVGASTQTSGLEAAVKNIETAMKSLGGSGTGFGKLKNQVSDLTEAMGKYKNIMSQKDANAKDLQEASRLYGEIENRIAAIGKTIGNIQLDPNKLMPKEALTRVETLAAEIAEMRDLMKGSDSSAIQAATQAYEQQKKVAGETADKVRELEALEKSQGKAQSSAKGVYTKTLNETKALIGANKELNQVLNNSSKSEVEKKIREVGKAYDEASAKAKSYQKALTSLETAKANLKISDNKTNQQALNTAEGQVKKAKIEGGDVAGEEAAALQKQKNALEQILKLKEKEANYKNAQGSYDKTVAELEKLKGVSEAADAKLTELKTELEALKAKAADTSQIEKLRQEFADLAGIDLNEVPTDMEELSKALNTLQEDKLNRTRASLDGVREAVDESGEAAKRSRAQLQEYIDELNRVTNIQQQIRNLTTSVLQFFSLTNGWQLLKRGVKEAYNSIKDLDDAMTEIAVVSDYTVDELWNMRQEYTQTARQVGMTTLDVVKAQTLYIQQGLDFAEATEASVETLKMAKIANIDAADATELMTAALRGYNMEMSEATRVNDVYSELAANTAANTEQIATAMSKTASIAYNAGASFENMSAFLSQIIETTQEAPETAGTAMKTIIARFQELKKSPLEIGEVDGETINANAIEAALAEAGVALRSTTGEFRNFDEVILELAGKWDTIDTMTQRYIATMAAGSRQQSRFLALMSDNERLVELTEMAAESSGSAQIQFEKTLDSLDAKVTKLKDAWQSYLRTLADNKVLKGAVDALTGILNLINDITGDLPPMIGSFVTLAMSFGGFKLAGGVLTKVFTKLGAAMYKGGLQAGAQGAKGVNTGLMSGLSKIGPGIKSTWGKLKGLFYMDPQVKSVSQLGHSVTKLTHEQRKLEIQQKKLQATSQQGYKHDIRRVNAGKELKKVNASLIANEKSRIVAEGQVTAAMTASNAAEKMSIEQSQAYQALRAKEIPAITAKAIAEGKLTQEQIEQIIATAAGNGATQEEIEQRLKAASAAMQQYGAEQTLGNQKKMGLLMQAKELIALLFASKARRKEALNTLAAAGAVGLKANADGTATGAQWALNAAIYACPLGWILVIILAVVAALAGLTIAAYRASDAFKMKQAEENLKKAKEGAEAVKEKAEELNEQINELKNSYSVLEGLTAGTKQWTDQLIETNKQVTELLKKYPQLSDYIETDGMQITTKEGWEEAVRQEMARQEWASNAALSAATVNYSQESYRQSAESRYATMIMPEVSTDSQGKYWSIPIVDGSSVRSLFTDNSGGLLQNPDSGKYAIDYVLDYYEELEKTSFGTLTEDQMFEQSIENGLLQFYKDTHGEDNYSDLNIYAGIDDMGNYIELTDLNEREKELYDNNKEALKEGVESRKSYEKDIYTNTMTMLQDGFSYNLPRAMGTDLGAAAIDLVANSNLYQQNLSKANELSESDVINQALEIVGLELQGGDQDGAALDEYVNNVEDSQKKRKDMKDTGETIVAAHNTQKSAEAIYTAAEANSNLRALLLNDFDAIETQLGEEAVFTKDSIMQLLKLNEDLDTDAANLISGKVEDLVWTYKNMSSIVATQLGIDKEAAEDIVTELGYTLSYKAVEISESLDEWSLTASAAFSNITQQASQDIANGAIGAKEEYSEFIDLMASNPFSSALQGAETLQSILKDNNQYALNFVAALDLRQFAATEQFQELYSILSDEQKDALKENGVYDSAKILEAADSNQQLNDALDRTGVSVSALAEYYQDLDNGILSASHNSYNFLEVLSKIEDRVYSVQDALAFLDTYDAGRSGTEVGQGFTDLIKEVQELYAKGAYGDQKIDNILGELLSEEKWNDIKASVNSTAEAIQQALSMFNLPEEGENFYQTWKQLAQTDTSGLFSLTADGQIQIHFGAVEGIDSQADVEQYLVNLGYGEEIANGMMADISTYMTSDIKELDKINLNDAIIDWLGVQKFDKATGVVSVLDNELQKLADKAGMSIEDFKNKLQEEFQIEGINFTIETISLESAKQTILEDKAINESDIDLLMTLGLNETEAWNTIDKLLADTNADLSNLSFDFNDTELNAALSKAKTSFENATEKGTSLGLLKAVNDRKAEIGRQIQETEQEKLTVRATAVGIAVGGAKGLGSLFKTLGTSLKQSSDETLKAMGTALVGTGVETEVNAAGLGKTVASTVSGMYSSEINKLQQELTKLQNNDNNATYTGPGGTGTITGYDANGRRTGTTGSGDSGSDDTWEEDYDWLYNMIQKLNKLIRDREKLEWDYDQLLRKRTTTENDLLGNMYAQKENLQEQLALAKEKEKLRKDELEALKSEFADVSAYVWWDDKLGIQINEEKMRQDEASISSEYGERIDEAVSEFERMWDEQEESMNETQDAIDGMEELIEEGMDEYKDLEERVIDAIVEMRQEQIDELENINESINDTNTAILDKLQEEIDEYRQDRDNEEDLTDIQEAERRLALMQTDTSGANALEIMKAEEDLRNMRQEYLDNQIDQALDNLSKDNEEAYEQRQKQIELMQEQLEADQETGVIAKQADELLSRLVSGDDSIANQIKEMLANADGTLAMGAASKDEWERSLTESVAKAIFGWTEDNKTSALMDEGIIKQGQTIEFTDKMGNTLSGVLQGDGRILANGNYYDDIFRGADGKYTQMTTGDITAKPVDPPEPPKEEPVTSTQPAAPTIGIGSRINASGAKISSYAGGPGYNQYYGSDPIYNVIGESGNYWMVRHHALSRGVTGWFKKSDVTAYQTGGLADFTGPAWLDGTKARPEYVLNAEQTKGFLSLVGILDNFDANGKKSNGDNYYDIHIEVDEIGDDYDVEQLMEKMKDMIVEDASYRNVNAVDLGRR